MNGLYIFGIYIFVFVKLEVDDFILMVVMLYEFMVFVLGIEFIYGFYDSYMLIMLINFFVGF